MTLIEIDQGVPQSTVQWLENSLIVDHLSKGRGLVWNPLYSLDYDDIQKRMLGRLEKTSMADGLNVLDTSNQSGNTYPFPAGHRRDRRLARPALGLPQVHAFQILGAVPVDPRLRLDGGDLRRGRAAADVPSHRRHETGRSPGGGGPPPSANRSPIWPTRPLCTSSWSASTGRC